MVAVPDDILIAFDISPEAVLEQKPIGQGLIHQTLLVTTEQESLVFQSINTTVFPQPRKLDRNYAQLHSLVQRNPSKCPPVPMRSSKSGSFVVEAQNSSFWKVSQYISQSVILESITNNDEAYQIGYGFGSFAALLNQHEYTWETNVPGFHQGPHYWNALEESFSNSQEMQKKELASPVFLQLQAQAPKYLDYFTQLFHSSIPTRSIHGDTKINNIVLKHDAPHKSALAYRVIDLDTLMNGSILWDLGDLLRSGAATIAEDAPPDQKNSWNLEFAKQLVQGFLDQIYPILTSHEKHSVANSAGYMAWELSCRFLNDFLNQDRYFGSDPNRPHLNLTRALHQLELVQDSEQLEHLCEELLSRY